MSTTNSTAERSTGTTRIEPDRADDVPEGAGMIGIDATGATHYLGNPVTNDGLPVYVTEGDDVEVFDLAKTPCGRVDGDAVDAWIDHVARKRGEWKRVLYGKPLAEMLADAVEVDD